MIETKYGEIPNIILDEYKARLTGKIFKLLPMKEEGSKTWDIYLESLLSEMVGNKEMIEELRNNAEFLSLLGTLEGILGEDDVDIVRREVFKALDILKKM